MNGTLARGLAAASVASGVVAMTQLYEHEQRQAQTAMREVLANLESQLSADKVAIMDFESKLAKIDSEIQEAEKMISIGEKMRNFGRQKRQSLTSPEAVHQRYSEMARLQGRLKRTENDISSLKGALGEV